MFASQTPNRSTAECSASARSRLERRAELSADSGFFLPKCLSARFNGCLSRPREVGDAVLEFNSGGPAAGGLHSGS